MEPLALPQLSSSVTALEEEVRLADARLEELRLRLRTTAVEADAARNPAQFRHASFARRAWEKPGAVVIGFPLGVMAGGLLVALIGALVGG